MRAFNCEKCGTLNILTEHLWNKQALPCETECGKCGAIIDTEKIDTKGDD